ncbi:MAG: hypothetical protein ACHQIK_09845 [Candidatus Acidiferrales bacterium]
MTLKKIDPQLARGWRASRVKFCLDQGKKRQLVDFLRQRFDERFFQPIKLLKRAPGNSQGFGFAIMSICSLLVETIQSFRLGLPSTYDKDLRELHTYNPPPEFQVPKTEWQNGHKAFVAFFSEPKHRKLFPGVNGAEFVRNIRNGLLHQAQTKGGWTITTRQKRLCTKGKRAINRNLFAARLEKAFRLYLRELRKAHWDDPLWKNTQRKIWWLIRLS